MAVISVKFKTTKNNITKMQQSIKDINGKKVNAGVFGENAWLAGIHEFGCTIKAKRAEYLTVPVSRKSAGKRAADFLGLFRIKGKSGELFLARNKGTNKKDIEVLFWLTKSVHIPERSFLRAGFDECHEDVIKEAERLIPLVLDGVMPAEKFTKEVGILLATRIKAYATDLRNPPNKQYTINAKGSSNPLVDTKRMIDSIKHEVE